MRTGFFPIHVNNQHARNLKGTDKALSDMKVAIRILRKLQCGVKFLAFFTKNVSFVASDRSRGGGGYFTLGKTGMCASFG